MLGDVFKPFTTNILFIAGAVWLFIIFIIILGNVVNHSRSSSSKKQHNKNSCAEYKQIQKQDKLLQSQQDKFNKALDEQRRQFEIRYNTLNGRFEKQKKDNEISQLQNEKFSKALEEQKRQFEIKYNTLNGRFEKQKSDNEILRLQNEKFSETLEKQKHKFETVNSNDEVTTPNTSFHNAFSSYQSHNKSASSKTFESKGSVGEIQIHTALMRNFGDENVFTDLYLTRQNGNHAQVDLVLISYYGIYIIESKKWNGTVTGSDNDSHWSQTIVDDIKGIVTNKYASPTRQNYGHIKAFCECFSGIPENKVFSIVVFNNLCKLLVNSRTPVMHREELVSYIKNISINQKKYFNDNDLRLLRVEIKKYSNPSETVKKQHVAYCNSKKQ